MAKNSVTNNIIKIEKSELLENTMRIKDKGLRLSQACAAYADGKFELSYSFSDDETYEYTTLRVIVGLCEPVASISEFYPYASFYENEMKELFGVNIEMIRFDYHEKLYRIKRETPLLPEEGRALKEQEEREAGETNV